MKPIIIEGTPKTPTIKFDVSEGIFEIKGRSIPENSVEFYKPLIDWLDDYKETPLDKTVVNIRKIVVFPAPSGPINPKISPESTSKLTSSTARIFSFFLPYVLVRFLTIIDFITIILTENFLPQSHKS